MFSVTVWLGAWQPKTGRRLRDCVAERREYLVSMMCHPHCRGASFSRLETGKKQAITVTSCFIWMIWVRCVSVFYPNPVPLVSCAQWAVGGLSARQKGLASEWGKSQPSWWFFSGCITISVEVPSVHQGHAIQCRERVIGPHHLPGPLCFLESLEGR